MAKTCFGGEGYFFIPPQLLYALQIDNHNIYIYVMISCKFLSLLTCIENYGI